MGVFTKLRDLFQRKTATPQPQTEEDDDLRICISDNDQTFRDTGGYKYYSNTPDSSKDNQK